MGPLLSEDRKGNIESIGGIDAFTALRLGFLTEDLKTDSSLSEQDVLSKICSRFHGKTIMDIGAGFSRLLDIIERESVPAELIAVDPIYENTLSASSYTRMKINQFASLLLRIEMGGGPKADSPWFREMKCNLERQLNEIDQYKKQSGKIQRFCSIPKEKKVDYVFLMSVLYYDLINPYVLLDEIQQILQPGAEIILIDFIDNRGNNVFNTVYNTGIPILGTHTQYFCAKLSKSDISKLKWGNLPSAY